MNKTSKLRLLNRAKDEFVSLSKSTVYKARWYKAIDLFLKCMIAICGALVAYASDNNNSNGIPVTYMKIFGIIITGFSAISSVFMFEKRSQSNMQVYSKCKMVIPEIDEKIAIVDDSQNGDGISQTDIETYLHKIFDELSKLSLVSFTDSAYGKISSSQRNID
jgi:hypothetical protein